jgi:hypothetical protein
VGPAVHIGVAHPNLGQLPLFSKIVESNMLQRFRSLQLTIFRTCPWVEFMAA